MFFFNDGSGYYSPKGNLTCNASGIVLGAGGVGEVNPVQGQPDKPQHHKIGLKINPRPDCGILKQK